MIQTNSTSQSPLPQKNQPAGKKRAHANIEGSDASGLKKSAKIARKSPSPNSVVPLNSQPMDSVCSINRLDKLILGPTLFALSNEKIEDFVKKFDNASLKKFYQNEERLLRNAIEEIYYVAEESAGNEFCERLQAIEQQFNHNIYPSALEGINKAVTELIRSDLSHQNYQPIVTKFRDLWHNNTPMDKLKATIIFSLMLEAKKLIKFVHDEVTAHAGKEVKYNDLESLRTNAPSDRINDDTKKIVDMLDEMAKSFRSRIIKTIAGVYTTNEEKTITFDTLSTRVIKSFEKALNNIDRKIAVIFMLEAHERIELSLKEIGNKEGFSQLKEQSLYTTKNISTTQVGFLKYIFGLKKKGIKEIFKKSGESNSVDQNVSFIFHSLQLANKLFLNIANSTKRTIPLALSTRVYAQWNNNPFGTRQGNSTLKHEGWIAGHIYLDINKPPRINYATGCAAGEHDAQVSLFYRDRLVEQNKAFSEADDSEVETSAEKQKEIHYLVMFSDNTVAPTRPEQIFAITDDYKGKTSLPFEEVIKGEDEPVNLSYSKRYPSAYIDEHTSIYNTLAFLKETENVITTENFNDFVKPFIDTLNTDGYCHLSWNEILTTYESGKASEEEGYGDRYKNSIKDLFNAIFTQYCIHAQSSNKTRLVQSTKDQDEIMSKLPEHRGKAKTDDANESIEEEKEIPLSKRGKPAHFDEPRSFLVLDGKFQKSAIMIRSVFGEEVVIHSPQCSETDYLEIKKREREEGKKIAKVTHETLAEFVRNNLADMAEKNIDPNSYYLDFMGNLGGEANAKDKQPLNDLDQILRLTSHDRLTVGITFSLRNTSIFSFKDEPERTKGHLYSL